MARKEDSYQFFLASLRRLMDRYEGQYVAIVGAAVVAHGWDVKRVYETNASAPIKRRTIRHFSGSRRTLSDSALKLTTASLNKLTSL